MAAMALTSPSPQLLPSNNLGIGSLQRDVKLHQATLLVSSSGRKPAGSRSLSCCSFSKDGRKSLLQPISAVGSGDGLEASISDLENSITIKNAEIVLESKDEEKMQVRVDLPGKETQIIFEKILRNLARTAPPVPGFRREKGGKTSKVPKDFLLQILGEERVTNFVLQEIITVTVSDYVKKENLSIKGDMVTTIQSAEELKAVFVPGKDFGFNATLQFETSAKEEPLEVEESTEDESIEVEKSTEDEAIEVEKSTVEEST